MVQKKKNNKLMCILATDYKIYKNCEWRKIFSVNGVEKTV